MIDPIRDYRRDLSATFLSMAVNSIPTAEEGGLEFVHWWTKPALIQDWLRMQMGAGA